MATYRSSAELAHKSLAPDDKVIFQIGGDEYRYTVHGRFLNYSGDNDIIFDKLGVNKETLANEAYGYTSGGGRWPEYHSGDYSAATKLVMKVFEIIEQRHGVAMQPAKITNTAELDKAGQLAVNDMIFFSVGDREIPMFVEHDSDGYYLSSRSCSGRGVLFDALGMGERARREFAIASTGKSPSSRSWSNHPQYRDMADFKKLIRALLVKCGQEVVEEPEVETGPSLVGKQYKDYTGDVVVVLADLGNVVLLSEDNEPLKAGAWFTKEELAEDYTPVEETSKKVVTMTKAEIVAKLGLGDVELQIAA